MLKCLADSLQLLQDKFGQQVNEVIAIGVLAGHRKQLDVAQPKASGYGFTITPSAQKLSLVSPFTMTLVVMGFPLRQTVALYAPSGTSLIEKAPVASVCAK